MISRFGTRTAIAASVFGLLDYQINRNRRFIHCDAAVLDSTSSFDTKGFALKYIPPSLNGQTSQTLHLSGVGMRRKNFYIVEVDVYLTALSLSDEALLRAQESFRQKKKLSDEILKYSNKSSIVIPEASVSLKFVRNVTTSQVVEAFNDAFVGCDQASVDVFKKLLRDSIGLEGMSTGNEIVFYWLKGGGITISKNGGQYGDVLRNDEIEKRLLEVYIDSKRTVSPQLVESIQGKLNVV